MVKEIVKDTSVLRQRSTMIKKGDNVAQIVEDLIDTATHHYCNCWGLAAIQIGIPKRAIVVRPPKDGSHFKVLINPTIKRASASTYLSEEGCLSLPGTSVVKRHHAVDILYLDERLKVCTLKTSGVLATVLQHEIDHLNGKLI